MGEHLGMRSIKTSTASMQWSPGRELLGPKARRDCYSDVAAPKGETKLLEAVHCEMV